jgi:hypothetical protein
MPAEHSRVHAGRSLLQNVAWAGRVSETASLASGYVQSDQFRGARIHPCNLAGLEIRDCQVDDLKIVDCYGSDVYPWSATLDQARLLLDAKLHEQVDGEWSLVETQRHLLFACDAWFGNAVLEEAAPYRPLGLPAGGMPPDAAAKLGRTLEATPTLDQVLAPRLASR